MFDASSLWAFPDGTDPRAITTWRRGQDGVIERINGPAALDEIRRIVAPPTTSRASKALDREIAMTDGNSEIRVGTAAEESAVLKERVRNLISVVTEFRDESRQSSALQTSQISELSREVIRSMDTIKGIERDFTELEVSTRNALQSLTLRVDTIEKTLPNKVSTSQVRDVWAIFDRWVPMLMASGFALGVHFKWF